MPAASTVENRSMFWSISASLNAVKAAASTATHGRASCQSSIGPSVRTSSTARAGHSGARAIIR